MSSQKRVKMMSSSSSSLSAPETIANNYDLLTQILLCLPIKSLLKFKCVSKHWLSLISNPHFYCRLNLSESPCAFFLEKFSLSGLPQFDFIKLDSSPDPDVSTFETLNFVNEPSEYAILPPPSQDGETYDLYLAFDSSKSPHYKVICVRHCDIERPDFQLDIYSSETGSWSISAGRFTLDNMDIGLYDVVFWNGAIHWYTDEGYSFCFDVDQEQIREMPMPPIPDDWHRGGRRRVVYFGESRGHLHLVEIYRPPSTQFNVCEMEKDNSGWSVKYRIDLDGVANAFPSVLNYYRFKIICIVRGKNDEDSYLVLLLPGRVVRYNLKDASFKKLCDSARRCTFVKAHEYIKSIACVRSPVAWF